MNDPDNDWGSREGCKKGGVVKILSLAVDMPAGIRVPRFAYLSAQRHPRLWKKLAVVRSVYGRARVVTVGLQHVVEDEQDM